MGVLVRARARIKGRFSNYSRSHQRRCKKFPNNRPPNRDYTRPPVMADDLARCTASAYLDPSYWDQRFGKEEHYEWFKDLSHFRHLLAPLLSPDISVLEVGCGNSRLGEELLREGVAGGVTCIDLSPVAVQRMRDRLAEQGTSGVDVVVADMLDMPFQSESFDLVIEKGTMDVLFVDSGDPWNPNPTTVDNVMKMLEGIHKVLKPDGIFVSVTFGQPHFRRRFFEASGFTWSVEWSTFGDGFHYFFYTLQKGKRSLESSGHQDTLPAPPSINMLHEELESEDYIFLTNVEELSL